MEFLNITAEYDTLALSRIEGIDTYNSRFNLLMTNLKKKPYDILNHRKDSFDIDFADFKLQLEEFNVSHCPVSCIYMQCVLSTTDTASGAHGQLLPEPHFSAESD